MPQKYYRFISGPKVVAIGAYMSLLFNPYFEVE